MNWGGGPFHQKGPPSPNPTPPPPKTFVRVYGGCDGMAAPGDGFRPPAA